ncbi:MAG: hypothetical protein H7Z39_01045 [Burkholderiaceae bacterium]|nr:hypothetical protein [Burkholderiaceae bacterium]
MNAKPLLLSLLTCAMLAGIGINPAVAQSTYTPGIDRAQEELSARIQQGVTAGRISRQEADELARRERGIQIRESRMKADGGADQREREQLRGELAALRADVENMINSPRPGNWSAGTNTPGIDRAQEELSARIQQGVAMGRISRQEADELARRERGIQISENRMKADGGADSREREQLRGELAGLRADVENMIARPPVVAPMPISETREYQVRDRIEQGLEDGNISRRDARRFNSRARDIERHEASYRADGVFTRSERIALRRESDALRNEVERMIRANRGGQVSVERRW